MAKSCDGRARTHDTWNLPPHPPPPLVLRFSRVHTPQSIVVAGLVKLNLIHEMGGWTTDNVEKGIQDLLVCVEMLAIAIAHTTAFSSKPYEDGATRLDGSSLLEAHFAHHSAIRDFNEVSQILFSSHRAFLLFLLELRGCLLYGGGGGCRSVFASGEDEERDHGRAVEEKRSWEVGVMDRTDFSCCDVMLAPPACSGWRG